MKKIGKLFSHCVIIFGVGFFYFGQCHADEAYTFIIKKQEAKEKNRWSLSDWLDTRDRMRVQDLWLAMHSPSPYEFYLGGNYQFNQVVGGPSFNPWEVSFVAFATIFGLEARYESGLNPKIFGIFDLRIFGLHDQATNLTLQVGLRNENDPTGSYRNILAGASLTLYLARFFGISGLYRHFFPAQAPGYAVSLAGDRFQGGAFLDFKFLRVFGDYFVDSETQATTNGWVLGIRLYF